MDSSKWSGILYDSLGFSWILGDSFLRGQIVLRYSGIGQSSPPGFFRLPECCCLLEMLRDPSGQFSNKEMDMKAIALKRMSVGACASH